MTFHFKISTRYDGTRRRAVDRDTSPFMVDLETLTWPHKREAKAGVVSTNHY
jgi:hypothetical protein